MSDSGGRPRDVRHREEEEWRSARVADEARRRILATTILHTFGSIVLALLVGAVFIVISDEYTRGTYTYFFAAPGTALAATWDIVRDAYVALFTGSVVDLGERSLAEFFDPLSETILYATPLILAGLGVAAAFRAGLFNIGAEGQLVAGAILAGYVGFTVDLPPVLHLLVAVLAGVLGGAFWGGIAGWLKARTGAHEVITTIMLNYVALYLLTYLLTLNAFQRPRSNQPISPFVDSDAQLPQLFGADLRAHLGIVLALGAAVLYWWLFARSTLGFRFRAVGANARAARTAGMPVERTFVAVMLVAGAFAGLAGANQALGTERLLTSDVSAGLGFDAITVALLGRASPLGTVLAGLLFGAFEAGSIAMEATTGTPRDIASVIQAMIVLFIAAPALVRAVLRTRAPDEGLGQVSKGWAG